MNIIKLFSRGVFATIAMSALVVGCDIVNDDPSVVDLKTTVYAFAGKPVLVNTASFAGGLDVRAVEDVTGKFGSLETLLDGQYLMYVPNEEFAGQQEDLIVSLDNSSMLEMTVKSLDGQACGDVAGVHDYANVQSGTEVVIDLLDNDVFCGIGYNGGLIGSVALEGIEEDDYLLTLGPGRSATFFFNPVPGFSGKVRVIYNLGINWIEGSGYENLSADQILLNPKKYLEAFTTSMVEIDVHN